MGDIDALLQPISADKPGGVDLYYEKEFSEITEARRQEVDAPQGDWEREIKKADYGLVAKLAELALREKTKDLRIAVFLAEAWIYRDGLPGLISGLQLLQGMIEKCWEYVLPLQESDGDLTMRAKPLDWFGRYDEPDKGSSPLVAVRVVPLNAAKHGLWFYEDRRKVPTLSEIKGDPYLETSRNELIADKKKQREEFNKSVDVTPKAFYKQLEQSGKDALENLNRLDELCRQRFKQFAPNFGAMRETLQDLSNTVHLLLLEKLKREPDPVAAPVQMADSGSPADSSVEAAPSEVTAEALPAMTGAINSADDAIAHVLAAARYLRTTQASSPLSYLLLRAVRWGEVRAAGEIRSHDLLAPSGDTRKKLRAAAEAKNWNLVLETAEAAMTSATGRGWLDLQRYAIKACDEMGYESAAKAMRSELKCFLADFPNLAEAILSDDTGAANPETLAWLRQENLLGAH